MDWGFKGYGRKEELQFQCLQGAATEQRPPRLEACREANIGALIIRIGFGGPLYYKYNKEPPKIVLVYSTPNSSISSPVVT